MQQPLGQIAHRVPIARALLKQPTPDLTDAVLRQRVRSGELRERDVQRVEQVGILCGQIANPNCMPRWRVARLKNALAASEITGGSATLRPQPRRLDSIGLAPSYRRYCPSRNSDGNHVHR